MVLNFHLSCNVLKGDNGETRRRWLVSLSCLFLFLFFFLLNFSETYFSDPYHVNYINLIGGVTGGTTSRPFHCFIFGGRNRSQILVAAVRFGMVFSLQLQFVLFSHICIFI